MLQASKREICTEYCGPGHKCQGDDCVACDKGFFQSAEVHKNISCSEWTKRSRKDHWVLAQNGSATQDTVYECEEGYYKNEYTPGSWECKLNEAPPTTTSTSIRTASPTSSTTSTSTEAVPRSSIEESDYTLACILVPIFIALAIFVLSFIIYLFCKRKLCFKNNKVLSNTSTESNSSELSEVISESTKPLINGFNQATPVQGQFEDFISHLSTGNLDTFFHVLPDPSKQFDFQVSMNKYRNLQSFEWYRLTFLDWVNVNKDIPQYKECVQQALNSMGSGYLYQTFLKDDELQSPAGASAGVNSSGHSSTKI